MSSLSNHVRDNFAGMLVFADVHGDIESLMRAYHYAESHDYFFASLGDLVDRSSFPFETVKKMHEVVKAGKGAFTIGNHDDKFHRLGKGAKVSLSVDARRTLADVGPERHDEFMQLYADLMDTPNYSAYFHKFDDITLVHAASHPCMWEDTDRFGNTAKSRALYGETNGDKYPDGYPVRLYSWIDEVPMGETVIVGHDRCPIFNVPITSPMVKLNKNGGKVIFLDTGGGKGGFLSGAVVLHDKKFKVDRFVEFK